MNNLIEKNYQSTLGYLQVITGAWCCYRFSALSLQNTENGSIVEKIYLKPVNNPKEVNQKSIIELNMNLAEDRVLSLSVYSLEGKDYTLKYIPNAIAETDVVEDIIEFM